jgi:two-component system chemotaxis response regulator CheB
VALTDNLAGGAAGLPPVPVRVLIVDDSVVARSVIARMIDGFVVGGAVSNARAAMDFLASNQVEVILLDIEMPGIDGLTALPDLLTAGKGAKVLIVSSSAEDGAGATIQALALGAADTLVKPGVGAFGGRFADVLEEKLDRLMAPHEEMREAVRPTSSPLVYNEFDIVAIGASTGGIHALSQLLRAIPPSFQLPILVTQHLPPSFMSYFAAQLAVLGSRPAEVAEEHMRVRPGRIIVAPGHAHMRVVRTSEGAAIRLSDEKVTSGCTPSVDPMFETVAQVYGARALGIVLSGMGRDGSEGAKNLIDIGAKVVVQDQASSVVWGMPGSVANAGRASAIMPPDEIGRLVASRRRPV